VVKRMIKYGHRVKKKAGKESFSAFGLPEIIVFCVGGEFGQDRRKAGIERTTLGGKVRGGGKGDNVKTPSGIANQEEKLFL